MTLAPPIQRWRPGLAPGVYEQRRSRPAVGLARLDRAVFIGLARRGPLLTPVDVPDWPTFERLFGGSQPGLLLPEAVRLYFANGGQRCLVIRCLDHPSAHTRPLALPGLEEMGFTPGSEPPPNLAARNPGGWASSLRLRLTLQHRPAPLRLHSASPLILLSTQGSLEEGDSLRLLVKRPDGAPSAPPPRLFKVAKLEAAPAVPGVERGDQMVTLQPTPDAALLQPELLQQARRLELTLEVWLEGRLLERWPEAALHPEHPRFLPRLLGRRAASEQFRPARVSSGDSESLAAEVDRLWGGLGEPWGSEFVRPSARLLDQSLLPTAALLERGEAWDLPLGDHEEPPWAHEWRNVADPDGAQTTGREQFFAASPAPPASDQNDRVLVFADRPGPLQTGGALDRWDETHPLEPGALFVLPDLLHPKDPDPLPASRPLPSPARCFATTGEPMPAKDTPAVSWCPKLTYDAIDLLAHQQHLVRALELRGQGIALLDLPLRRVGSRFEPLRAAERAAWLADLRSDRAAVYYPWLQSRSNDTTITLPPTAAAAGLIASFERGQGVWRAPANRDAQGILGTSESIGEELAGALHAERINAFRPTPTGYTLLGSRTTSSDPDWTHLSVRRLIDWLKLQIASELAWAPFEPNGPMLWEAMAGIARRRLRQVFDAGGLAGATEEESFFVRCDAGTTSARERDAGRVVLLVGVAPAQPAEFLVVELIRRGGDDPGLEVR